MEWLAVIPRPRRALRAGLALIPILLAAATVHAEDADWPRRFDSASGTFIIYQPQPEALNGDVLSERAAFSLQRPGDAEPTFGVLWFNETIQIDRDSSRVEARDLDVTRVRLPGITPAEASRYEKRVEAEAVGWDLSGSLEELRAGLASADRERASVADLETAPPRILFSTERAILLAYDGAPAFEPIAGSRLERVANTPYAVVHDPAGRAYYLNGANLWYTARDPLGPWGPTARVPADVRAAVPPDTAAADRVDGPPPRVITATEPAELIATDGPPAYAPLVAGDLLYVTNTESDVVREVGTQALYVLLAGRWYRATSTDGPWTFVRGDRLPPSFARIPPGSAKAHLLASVAGTDAADDAVADAEVPQTSAIRRNEAGFRVVYDGPPRFEPIEGTRMEYAVNTDADVVLADGRYYACDQGVWYIADDPEGPWRVSETRPTDVDEIPPTCPVYDVRYVYIYDWTPEVVYVGYLPGYIGCYPYYGTVVYGTGCHYHAWRGRNFYPRPCTWGYAPHYNPWASGWSFGASYQTGFLHVGFRWHSDPARPSHDPPRWFGPGGYRRPALTADLAMLRNRRPSPAPLRPADRAPINLYRRAANLARVDRTATPMPARPIAQTTTGPAAVPNNVFAGRDGNVYRRDDAGWRIHQGRSWLPAPAASRPSPTPPTSSGGTGRGWPASRMPAREAPPGDGMAGVRPRMPSPPHPAPVIGSAPGNLEREFRGRNRARGGPPPPSEPKPPKEPKTEKEHPGRNH